MWIRISAAAGTGAERVDLGTERAERRQDLVRLVVVAEHGAVDDDDLAAAEELRDVRQRRDLQHPGRRADRVRGRLRPLDVRGQDLLRPLPRPDHHPGDELLDLVERDLHRDDDAEASTAAAQRPEQLGVLRPVGAQERAVCGDDLDGEHALGREAVLPCQPADSAAERVADDADVRRRAVQRGQTLLGGRVDHVLPQRSGLDPRATVLRVDLDGAHLAHVEQQRSVERAVHGGTVPRALNDDLQIALGGVRDGADTSSTVVGSTTTAGRRSAARFQDWRASSQRLSSGKTY